MRRPAPAGTGPDENIGALTGIRFVAALWIVLEHYHGTQSEQLQHPIIALGYGAVTFFLMLSGYFLTQAYLFKDGVRARDFWWSRFVRIYPLYLLSGLVLVPFASHQYVMAHSGHPTGRVLLDVASYGLLAQAWAFWHWSLNAPAWTVSAFASFYLLFPFVGAWLKRRSTTGLWITAAGCLAASCAIALVAVAVMSSAGEIIYANTKSAPVSGFSTAVVRCVHNLPLARLPEFLCGMVLAVLVKRGAIPAALCRHGFVAGALAIVALIACARWVPYLLMNNALFIIPSAAIILGSLHRHAWLEKTLGHRWMGMLGCASFSLYLVHIPLLTYFRLACDTLGLPTGGAAFELAYLALVIPASVLVYSGVEEPIRLALRKFGPAKAAKTPPAEIPRAPAPAIGESVVTARPRPVASVATASFDHDSVPARSPAHAAVEVPVLAGCS